MAVAAPNAVAPRGREEIRPANFFANHDAHPIVLDLVLVTAFGKEWWEWDSVTLWASLQDHFGPRLKRGSTLNVSELTRNKIHAVKTLHASDGFWTSWDTFVPVILALANNIPRFDVLHRPSVGQLMAGVDMSITVRAAAFSDEVARFVAACCLDNGVWYLPPPLDFAQTLASRPMYECPDCGNEDDDDRDDGVCDQCALRFQGEKNLDGKVSPGSPSRVHGEGKNLRRYRLNDPDPVRFRHEEVAGTPLDQVDLKETQTDVCLAKVLVAQGYMNECRRRMIAQMEGMEPWVLAR